MVSGASADGLEAYRRVGQLEEPWSDASFFARRGMPYPSFSSARSLKELRGGHSGGVRALAWNANGDSLISCGHDRVVRAWHPDRGTDIRSSVELTGHTDQVSALACHPHHPHLVATGSLDRTVRLWDLRQPSPARIVTTPGANINLAYSPDGRYLAVGDKSETVSLIDAEQGTLLHTIKDGSMDREEINELAWSPDGSLLLLPMGSGGISFLRAPDTPDAVTEEAGAPREHGFHPSWKRILLRPAHPAAIFCIAWDPKSRLVATTAADSTLALWDAKDWDSVHVFSEFIFPPRCIDFSCDGEWLAAGGEDAHVFLISTVSQRIAHKIPVSSTINSLAWHPSKPLLAYSGTDPAATAQATARSSPIWLYSLS
ncbi:tho complex subunit 3 [Malassezia pachydermatis]|uniref:Tho complex subunit 3 n=1 Tax=Malassezia pachydermatis TaxID=77020 RepID=A0A0M8MNT6_9BASI|nr:tho complex subunit 3 [Malassezia pachydermatis]KOS16236.1 tho complex subunit 3 [Malassezia pachydermatis]